MLRAEIHRINARILRHMEHTTDHYTVMAISTAARTALNVTSHHTTSVLAPSQQLSAATTDTAS